MIRTRIFTLFLAAVQCVPAYAQSGLLPANQVWAGPASGGQGFAGSRALVGADLPNPSASTLGGVRSLTCAAHQWLNTISIAGVPACAQPSISDISGLGSNVQSALQNTLNASSGLVSFNGVLGTVQAGSILTNATGTAAGLTAGNVTTNANMTGDVTSVGNATTLTNAPVIAKVLTGYTSGAGTVSATDSILAAIQKLNGNDGLRPTISGSPTAGQSAVWASGTAIKGVGQPTVSTALNSGTATGTGGFVSGTYTTPAGATWLEIEGVAGGGGASGSGTTPGSGGTGGNTTFGTSLLTANGGSPGLNTAAAGAGGTASGGYWNPAGQAGLAGSAGTNTTGGVGGSSLCGPGAGPAGIGNQGGSAGTANSGGGGGGAGDAATPNTGAGGGGGGCFRAIITSPLATYAYSVGAAGTSGSAGTGGQSGGAGGTGRQIVIEHYN